MKSRKFDQEAAIRNIIGVSNESEEKENTMTEDAIENITDSDEKSLLVVAKDKNEKRTKTIHVLIKPSTHNQLKKKCKILGVSLNECINQLLETWINV